MARKLRDVADKLEENPAPMGGTTRKSVDLVLSALKAGSTAMSLMAGLLASILILYSGYVLYDSFSTSYGAYKSSWDLLQYKPEVLDAEPSAGQDTLAAITKDYQGWLTVYDSNIDYPIVQGENDLYYASHDVYGNTSLTGAIYLEAGNTPDGSDNYNLIYGHHMDNGAMFGQLDSFRSNSFYSSHREGIWVTESGVYDIYCFAVVSTDAYENNIYSVGNRAKEVRDFLEGDRDGDAGLGTTVLHYDQEIADTADRILALSTCASAETNGRLVVFFRMTERALPTFTPEPTETPTATETTSPTTSKPTTTPIPKEKVKLTVHYVYEDGTEAFETKTYTYDPGSNYYVVSPRKPGYEASQEVVQGTITEDMTVTVVYTLVKHKLTIRYLYDDGKKAAESYIDMLSQSEEFNVKNPVIEGYTTARVAMKGKMGGEDIVLTVLYLPEELTGISLCSIDELEVPLEIGQAYIQIGLGIE